MNETFTIPQIQNTLASLGEVYDIVRVVDPTRSMVFQYPRGCSAPVCSEYSCYAVWNKAAQCENCISAYALHEKTRKTKYEFVNQDIYHVVSKYIEVEGRRLTLEIVCRINDEVLLGAFGHNEFIQKIIEYNHTIYTDALTGAYNRRFLAGRSRMTDKADGAFSCSFAMLDIDNFKDINDSYGHAAGDAALIALVNLLQSRIRPQNGDCVVRYGGDEFLLMMSKVSHEVFIRRMEQILEAVNALAVAGHPGLRLELSVGGASQCEREDAPYAELIHLADQRMYAAKNAGGNRLVIPPRP